MKYVVEFRNAFAGGVWDEDEQFDILTDAIEYASKECMGNPRMEHRIVRVHTVEEVMVFPSTERVTQVWRATNDRL